MSYSRDSEKVFDTFLEMQRNLGKLIDVYIKTDGRHVRGKLSDRKGEFYLSWPKLRITVRDAVVSHSGEEKKYSAVRLSLNPILGDFEYEFLDRE